MLNLNTLFVVTKGEFMFIGTKLEAIRKSKKMSLTELSQSSGVQMATLSRIENMKMVGTLESHINIATALGVDVTELYQNLGKQSALIEFNPLDKKTDVFTHSEHSTSEILTKNILQKKMMPVLIKIDVKGKTNLEQNQKGAEKFIFILDGIIEASIKDQKFTLHKNNTLYFDAALPHSFVNIGKTAAKILCTSTPVSL